MSHAGRRPDAPARPPAVAVFVTTALAVALTAGFGLGLWLLLSRTLGLTTFGVAWLALVQVHGTIQLFGFAALFLMGIGLHVLPRFRGAPPAPRGLQMLALLPTVAAILLRSVAQPATALPGRDALLALSGILFVAGTGTFALAALRALRGGTNPHRPDELVMAAGVAAAPVAAILLAAAIPLRDAPLVLDQAAEDRAVWAMLLGCLATAIFGVWARLAPAFIAAPPARSARLLAGAGVWLAGVAMLALRLPFAGAALLAGVVVVTWALGVYGPSIARQPLAGHARLVRYAVRGAFAWALAGAALLAWYDVRGAAGGAASYLELSGVRHAFALGLVTQMIYGVASRALPSFLDRRPWSERAQLAVLVLANAGVALRVVPGALADGAGPAAALLAASGVLSYLSLALFAGCVAAMLRTPPLRPPARGTPVPMAARLGPR